MGTGFISTSMKRQPLTNKILFVDDEESILQGFKLTVGRNYEISVASSGKKGLELYDRDGPFAVVVSDFAMPEMNGAEFLGELRKRDSSVVTMLLTGEANIEEVSEVVSSGGIFRLLNKPCSSEKLKRNVEEALRQYNLIRAEKELLEETLNGSITALISLFSASKPLFFGRAQRVKKLAVKVAEKMEMEDVWCIELATIFSYLGYLTLPDSELEKIYNAEELSPEVQMIISGFPAFVEDILSRIPRIKRVSKIVALLAEDNFLSDRENKKEGLAASVIRLAQTYENCLSRGMGKKDILDGIKKHTERYSPRILKTLGDVLEQTQAPTQKLRIKCSDLKEGMCLQEELRLPNGTLVAPKGMEVTYHFIRMIDNYVVSYFGNPFPSKIEVIQSS